MQSTYSPPKLYTHLASWFHLLSAPAEYAEEAEFARQAFAGSGCGAPVVSLLELGSGGGNNAFHLKRHFHMTLSDLSPGMLELSRGINPECEHIVGDMRHIRLERLFDAVFVHDAVMYLTTAQQLKECMQTAFIHCRPGGSALFMPDFIKETFVSCVHHGGHDGELRGLRYFEWTFDPDLTDTTYTTDFVYLMRDGNSPVHVEHDCHVEGLFPKDTWIGLLEEVGFSVRPVEDPYGRQVFIGCRDGAGALT